MKKKKISKKEQFSYIFKNGKFMNFDYFTINYAKKLNGENNALPRYSIITSKKVGNAVKRNFAKRRVRALNKLFYINRIKELDYIVVVKKKLLDVRFKNLSLEFEKALHKINKSML